MAVSESSYGVGNRVYRGGSSAPTMGTVDPRGYVERSLNQDSDKRSGLAAAALKKLNGQGADGQQGMGSPSTSPLGNNHGHVPPNILRTPGAKLGRTATGKLTWEAPEVPRVPSLPSVPAMEETARQPQTPATSREPQIPVSAVSAAAARLLGIM